jgi:glycerol-3-phosphate dehydrogenase
MDNTRSPRSGSAASSQSTRSDTSSQSTRFDTSSATSGGKAQDLRGKAGEAASKIADVAQQAGTQAKEAAASLASDAQQKARGLLNMQVTAGADLAGHVAESAHCAADNLDQNAPQLAELVRGAAERVDEFAQDLRGRTVEDLVRTASDFTRRQPALMFGLASLAGFLAFRVLKSMPPRSSGNQLTRSDDPYRHRPDDPYRDRQFSGERLGQFHGT